jgi:hypothetical protein
MHACACWLGCLACTKKKNAPVAVREIHPRAVPRPGIIQDDRASGSAELRGARARVRSPVRVVVEVTAPEAEACPSVLWSEVGYASVELQAEWNLARECAEVLFFRVAADLPRPAVIRVVRMLRSTVHSRCQSEALSTAGDGTL